jgi:hypothetical protein
MKPSDGIACIILLAAIQANGFATPLGRISLTSNAGINQATLMLAGTFTMTTPSGAAVTGLYTGTLLPGAAPGTFTFVLDATVTAGTGRFAGATGDFFMVAPVALSPSGLGTFDATFSGLLTLPRRGGHSGHWWHGLDFAFGW